MKSLKQYILEALVNKKVKATGNVHTLFPKSIHELEKMIAKEMIENGNECSLNHIDTSDITDMSNLFSDSSIVLYGSNNKKVCLGDFNGDISKWDVSNVTDMDVMFDGSKYTGENGDLSKWDVSNVTTMQRMFANSQYTGKFTWWQTSSLYNTSGMFANNKVFNGDLSMFDMSNVRYTHQMFTDSVFTGKYGDITNWDMSNVIGMTEMFMTNDSYSGDISSWDVSSCENMSRMFMYSSINVDISKWRPKQQCLTKDIIKDSSLSKKYIPWLPKHGYYVKY